MLLLQRPTRADWFLWLHFFHGFFESDLLSVRDQLSTVLSSVAALLASFGLILPVLFNHKYRMLNAQPTAALYHEAALADKLMFLCFAIGFSAVATLLKWHSLFPERKDYLILGPLPLERLHIFRAKLSALLTFVTLVIVASNLLPAFSLTAIMSGRWQLPANSFLHIISLFTACCLAGYFTFFALLAFQALLLNFLPPSWFARCSLAAQGVLLILVSASLPLCLWLPALHSLISLRSPFLSWLPPIWFLGLSERLLSSADSQTGALAWRAIWVSCSTTAAALLLYGLAYVGHAGQTGSVTQPDKSMRLHALLSGVLTRVSTAPQEAAIVSFSVRSMLRSKTHKLLLAAVGGACLALVLDGFLSLLIERTLHHQRVVKTAFLAAASSGALIFTFFLLIGLLFIFSIPIEIRANWVFRLSNMQGHDWGMAAAEKLLIGGTVIPAGALTMSVILGLANWPQALSQTFFVLLMSLALLELLLWNWNRIPFTCSYFPGKRNIVQSLVVFAVALGAFAYLATTIELSLTKSPPALTVFLVSLGAVTWFLRTQRRRSWTGGLVILFDDQPDPAVQTLALGGE